MLTANRFQNATAFNALTVSVGLFFLPSLGHAQEQLSLEVNGTTLHYVQQGEGEPVVFVHGAISDLRTWGGQVPALVAAGFQTIAYTQRYYGTEPWQDAGELFSAATAADDLAAFVKALDLGPVHLVGWSSGGEIAMLAALEHPELFRSMAHYEPVLEIVQATEEGKAMWAEVGTEFGAAFGPTFETISAGDLDLGVEQFLDAVWERPGTFDRLAPEVQQVLLDQGRTVMPFFSAPALTVTCEALAALDIPTLLMVGEETGLRIFSFMVEEITRCMPSAQKVVIAGATHGGPVQAADVVNAEIGKFLSAN